MRVSSIFRLHHLAQPAGPDVARKPGGDEAPRQPRPGGQWAARRPLWQGQRGPKINSISIPSVSRSSFDAELKRQATNGGRYQR
jgi:hypothetical protein